VTREARLAVIHNGCPPCDPTVAADPVLARLGEGGLTVGAVSVLRRQKRLDVLLRAAPRILAAVPDARVAVVGDGPEQAALEALAAELGLTAEPRFALLPYTGTAARALRCLDVYVLPSAWEAFPIGVLEAQACGVPQVATDVGGTGEAVVAATGRLVPPGDPDRLADAVVDLLRDEAARRAMARASVERHAAHFTVDRMVAATAGLYGRVLGR
jgi:glycosyltransferase involved in cell wall biosynthesis